MIDRRFYTVSEGVTTGEIARWLSAPVPAVADRVIVSVGAASKARPDELTFIEKDSSDAVSPEAGACLIHPDRLTSLPDGVVAIPSHAAKADFARIARRVVRPLDLHSGNDRIHPTARLEDGVEIEPGSVIGAGAVIGAHSRIGANAVIGPGVQVGRRAQIGCRVSIRCALIGDGVTIASGAVIGEAGFGVAGDFTDLMLIPHFGRVIIQDGASVGANSCIDRGLFDDTVIGDHAHIDNLCHIGHNSVVGSRTVMAAFAGISGSVRIGANVQLGGRVGVADHVDIGDNARLAAGSAVMRNVPAGETHAGHPAKLMGTWLRELAWVARAAQKRGD